MENKESQPELSARIKWFRRALLCLFLVVLVCAFGIISLLSLGSLNQEGIDGARDLALVLAGIVGIAAAGYLHYAIWGHAVSRQVAMERAVKILKSAKEDDDPMP